ncbi:hypothetical protein ACFL1H_00365 [Nanoarchaeota archaeon]
MEELTGNLFVQEDNNENVVKFQLEASIDGDITRLEAEGKLPEACLHDNRHSGLRINSQVETCPPKYEVNCDCGYKIVMRDINEKFEPYFDEKPQIETKNQ